MNFILICINLSKKRFKQTLLNDLAEKMRVPERTGKNGVDWLVGCVYLGHQLGACDVARCDRDGACVVTFCGLHNAQNVNNTINEPCNWPD